MARALRARKTITPRFTDFFTDFEKKKPTVLQSAMLPSIREAGPVSRHNVIVHKFRQTSDLQTSDFALAK